MKAALNLFKIQDVRRKILVTLGLLFVYRIGHQVPLPGVNIEAVKAFVEHQGGGGLGFAFGIMNALSGAAIGECTLFTLGVMPYISASIILSLLTKVIPQLEQLSKEGMAGHKKINQYTRYLTVPLCVIQGMFVINGLLAQGVDQMEIIDRDLFGSFAYRLLIMLAFTAGTLFIMWLGEQISEHGIGNGVSMIIMAGIIARMPSDFAFLMDYLEKSERAQTVFTFAVLFILVVGFVVFITKGQRRIPVQQAKLTRGRRIVGGARHYLPLRVNQAGVMPIIFASALFIIPPFLERVPFLKPISDALGWGRFWYVLLYVVLIYFFSFFWTALMFQPTELANNLKEYGGFVPGLRPGKRTADYLESVMVRVTLAGATFLALISVLPQMISSNIGDIPPMLATFLGGTSILIVVSVALDLVDKLNAHLVMRNYDGFMTTGGATTSWARGRKR
ncbi:MAG: preprotein translocase subunit SecY [Planctomycetota bacterium]